MSVVCAFLIAYLATLAIRAVMSWFPPPQQSNLLAQVQRAVVDVTEPVLAPVRRLLPAQGPLDWSFLLVLFLTVIIINVLCANS
jgi:YggT family protein